MSGKLILVIGVTGAQGIAVIDALLAPGSPSLYAVRAFTRDPDSKRAQELKAKGVELAKGSFEDFPAVYVVCRVFGATLTASPSERLARSTLECASSSSSNRPAPFVIIVWKTNYNPDYRSEHHDAKARVADLMKANVFGYE